MSSCSCYDVVVTRETKGPNKGKPCKAKRRLAGTNHNCTTATAYPPLKKIRTVPAVQYKYLYQAVENDDFEQVKLMIEVHGVPFIQVDNENPMSYAAGNGRCGMLQYLHEKGCPIPDNIYSAVARGQNYSCLIYIHQTCKVPFKKFFTYSAAKHNCIRMLQYYYNYYYDSAYNSTEVKEVKQENSCLSTPLVCSWPLQVPWHPDTLSIAASNGHFDCFQYCVARGCPKDGLEINYIISCYKDREELLEDRQRRRLHQLQYCLNHGWKWNELTMGVMAEYGYVELMKFALDNGCPISTNTLYKAAENGHLDCLKFAHEHGGEWDPETTYAAALNQQRECLQYALDHDCPVHEDTVMQCQYSLDMFELMFKFMKNKIQFWCILKVNARVKRLFEQIDLSKDVWKPLLDMYLQPGFWKVPCILRKRVIAHHQQQTK